MTGRETRAGLETGRLQGAIGAGMIFVLGALGLLHAVIAPYANGQTNVARPLLPPMPDHPLGSDVLGRDLFSETLHALSVTLADSAIALLIVLSVGNLLGLFTAHALGRTGPVLRSVATVFASVPSVLLAVLIAALMGRENAALAAGLAAAPYAFLRSFDSGALSRDATYTSFAKAAGVGVFALMRRDIVYSGPIAVMARGLASVAVTLSTLSFFGFGAVAPQRDLGLMIASARTEIFETWWTAGAPALTLILLVFAARLAARLSGGEQT